MDGTDMDGMDIRATVIAADMDTDTSMGMTAATTMDTQAVTVTGMKAVATRAAAMGAMGTRAAATLAVVLAADSTAVADTGKFHAV